MSKPTQRPEVIDQVVRLDYAVLRDTVYRKCKLVFEGGRPPIMSGCDFIECEFIFEGPARNAQEFLTILAHGGAAELVVHGMLGLHTWREQ